MAWEPFSLWKVAPRCIQKICLKHLKGLFTRIWLIYQTCVTFFYCPYVDGQRRSLVECSSCSFPYEQGWCFWAPKINFLLFVTMFTSVFHSSSVAGFQYRRTGWSGGPHRNNRGDPHQRLHHGLWDPASGRSFCHGNPVLSSTHCLHRPRQPGGAVRSPNTIFINLQCFSSASFDLVKTLGFNIPDIPPQIGALGAA